MVTKYILRRVPVDVNNNLKDIKTKMENDVKFYTGKTVSIPLTRVLRAISSPAYNENYIQVDINKLIKLSRVKK